MMLTVEQLKNVLDYDADTGVFVWRTRPSKAVKVGDVAGCVEKRIGYVTIGIAGRIYKAHRLAWLYTYDKWPRGLIDHINGNKSDNRITNLRDVFADGNAQNVRSPNKRNKSGFMGVIWFQNKWRASMSVNGKSKWLGDYSTPEEAHQVYLEAKRKYHAACTI
jgi:hypothetical protein